MLYRARNAYRNDPPAPVKRALSDLTRPAEIERGQRGIVRERVSAGGFQRGGKRDLGQVLAVGEGVVRKTGDPFADDDLRYAVILAVRGGAHHARTRQGEHARVVDGPGYVLAVAVHGVAAVAGGQIFGGLRAFGEWNSRGRRRIPPGEGRKGRRAERQDQRERERETLFDPVFHALLLKYGRTGEGKRRFRQFFIIYIYYIINIVKTTIFFGK